MNPQVKNYFRVLSLVACGTLLWPSCERSTTRTDDPNVRSLTGGCDSLENVIDSLGGVIRSLEQDLDSLLPDSAGASTPSIPLPGEVSDVNWSAVVFDRPCVYACKRASTERFTAIVVAIPHDNTHKYVLVAGSPAASGDTLIYAFEEASYSTQALSVWTDVTATQSADGVKFIKVIARRASGGGEDVTIVHVENADEDSPTVFTPGMPLLWNKRIPGTNNVEHGGFIYGLASRRPTGFTSPPAGSDPGSMAVKTGLGISKLFYSIARTTFSDGTPSTWNSYKSQMELFAGPGAVNRSYWFVQ